MIKKDFTDLIGKDKKAVLAELGDQFNHYPSRIWTYHLGKSFLGRNLFLIIYFEDGEAVAVRTVISWRKTI